MHTPGMAKRYAAAVFALPFGILRGYAGTDLPPHPRSPRSLPVHRREAGGRHGAAARRRGDPRTAGRPGGERAALGHHRRAEGGRPGRERAVVTVEEIVDELDPRPGAVVLPAWTVSSVAPLPGGSHPSYAIGYSSP